MVHKTLFSCRDTFLFANRIFAYMQKSGNYRAWLEEDIQSYSQLFGLPKPTQMLSLQTDFSLIVLVAAALNGND